jgi:hypothetical protein
VKILEQSVDPAIITAFQDEGNTNAEEGAFFNPDRACQLR